MLDQKSNWKAIMRGDHQNHTRSPWLRPGLSITYSFMNEQLLEIKKPFKKSNGEILEIKKSFEKSNGVEDLLAEVLQIPDQIQ